MRRDPGLSPEAQLILSCLTAGNDTEPYAHRDDLLSQTLNWDWIMLIALRNHVAPLLYQSLQTAANGSVPEAHLEGLRQYFYQTLMRNLFLQGELLQLLRLFASNDIPAMPVKGPTLTELLYPNLGSRPFWDLDIFVHKQDVLRVKDLLTSRGYCPERNLSGTEEVDFLESDCEYNFNREGGNVHVEIHWDILPRFMGARLNADHIWQRAVPQCILGVASWGLPPEDLFLMLCQHAGEKHEWGRLKWLCDLAMLIQHTSLDWDMLLHRAALLHLEQPVRQGLYLAASFFGLGAALPTPLSRELYSDPNLVARAAIVRARLFRNERGLPGFSEWRSYMQADMATLNEPALPSSGLGQFLLYLKTITRPEFNDRIGVARTPLPSAFYYVWRPARLWRIHGLRLLHRLR